MLRSFLALVAIGFSIPALGETLVSGAIYFDSENTLREVLRLSALKDNTALGQLVESHHVSEKIVDNTDIQLYLAGPNPESPAEFRFINNPTTYWTLTKFIEGIRVTPNPNSNSETTFTPVVIPGPSSTPIPTPTPTPTPIPTPTPSPKSVTAIVEREDTSESENPSPPRKHYRAKEHHRSFSSSHPPSNDDEVPNDRKVWHLVNGHWKWYEKRPGTGPAPSLEPNVPTAAPVLRAQPVTPPSP